MKEELLTSRHIIDEGWVDMVHISNNFFTVISVSDCYGDELIGSSAERYFIDFILNSHAGGAGIILDTE